jgi:hypothetical protein
MPQEDFSVRISENGSISPNRQGKSASSETLASIREKKTGTTWFKFKQSTLL